METVLAAVVCLLLLGAPKCRGTSGSSVVATDGGLVIVREIPVAFGEVDWRVLVAGIDAELGLITCLEDVWFQPVVWTKLTIVTEKRRVKKQSEKSTEKHDTEMRWLLRKHIESSSHWAKHQRRMNCAREKCARACVRTSKSAVHGGTHLQQRDVKDPLLTKTAYFWRKCFQNHDPYMMYTSNTIVFCNRFFSDDACIMNCDNITCWCKAIAYWEHKTPCLTKQVLQIDEKIHRETFARSSERDDPKDDISSGTLSIHTKATRNLEFHFTSTPYRSTLGLRHSIFVFALWYQITSDENEQNEREHDDLLLVLLDIQSLSHLRDIVTCTKRSVLPSNRIDWKYSVDCQCVGKKPS